ncbi:hypothetical protein [Streptomyces syringium]|uniref:Immunity protein 49 n=1 Tax=Streptomyces syringium TaxID=76729 RepID=A0ABS4XWK3_9ACTN|nr:hypothetical protein [Streptomyces syringium]MBP2400889.1 hypothetical protein [Streptomyces syringium]
MSFNTYHWWGCSLLDGELESARDKLADERNVDAFLVLLRSGRTAAVGIALDHFHHAGSTSRHHESDPFAPYAAEVLARAREILAHPPTPADETGAEEDGADHASALLALLNLAAPEDSELIASALRHATTANAVGAAAMAAATALERSATPHATLIRALTDIVFDESREIDQRVDALKAFDNVKAPQAVDVLDRALRSGEFALQAEAAFTLVTHHMVTHRAAVEGVAALWPDDAPWPAAAVRAGLHDVPPGDGAPHQEDS